MGQKKKRWLRGGKTNRAGRTRRAAAAAAATISRRAGRGGVQPERVGDVIREAARGLRNRFRRNR